VKLGDEIRLPATEIFFPILSSPYSTLILPSYRNFTTIKWHISETTAQSKLEINQTLKIDLKMQVGSTSDSMTVESNAGTVETINPTLGRC